MQLKNLEYRDDALKLLKKHFYSLLPEVNTRNKIVFKAPTGSGKTVTMAILLRDLVNELPNRFDIPNRNVAYIWIAPNTLHLQSYESLKHFFEETRDIRTMQFEDITDDKLSPNELLFLNWQSISSEDNLYVRESETDKTLYTYIQNTKNDNTEIVLILDEAHLFASKGEKAKVVLSKINARIEIDVTATPDPRIVSDYHVIINRKDVVKEQMIKKGVNLNPHIKDAKQQTEENADIVLLKYALAKRNELAEKYKKQGSKMNPLLLIQLPSESAKITDKDNEIKQLVKDYLFTQEITESNHQLAVWMSGSDNKVNLKGISENDSIVNVLLFKQAIALGWDCPRAHVLLIYRELQQESFTVQTLGRILRMPEQKHYTDESLNYGFVYTNLEQKYIKIEPDEMDYISFNKSERKPIYNDLNLPSYYIESILQRNRIGLHFRETLFEVALEMFPGLTLESKDGEPFYSLNLKTVKEKNYFEVNVADIDIEIPSDVLIEAVQESTIEIVEKAHFAKTAYQLEKLFNKFCIDSCGEYQKDASWERIKYHLKLFLTEYFNFEDKTIYKIVLHNKQVFTDLINKARELYAAMMEEKAKTKTSDVKELCWEVPEFRIYNNNFVKHEVDKAILDPLFLRNNNGYLSDSKTEFDFIQFLESNKSNIVWWYKNGTERKADFAVPYINSRSEKSLFYVDFVILFNSGTLGLFDTKTPESDKDMVAKHNSLNDYISERNKSGKVTVGGIIINKDDSWRYSKEKIENGYDVTGWDIFNPAKN